MAERRSGLGRVASADPQRLSALRPRGDNGPARDAKRSVTITDVAKAAGVSIGTVSHYINRTANVSPHASEAIRVAIESLDYQPNVNARSLRVQSTDALGLVLPNITNPFYAEIAALIGDQARDLGYQLLLCSSGDDEGTEELHLRSLHQRRVDGALVVTTGRSALERSIGRLPFPCIFVDRAVAGKPSVTTDNRLGGRLGLEHLITLGHRDIGLVVGDEYVENIQERLAGATQALREHELEVAAEHVLRGRQSIETGRQAERFWQTDRPPTAVFATNDVIALGVWQSCLAAGVRVPDDVSLMGFDNIGWSRLTVPPLTTVAQDVGRMTSRALELLLSAFSGEELSETTELIQPGVVVRQSTRRFDGHE